MITRIVKLSIADEYIVQFRTTFRENHERISNFPGCEEVRLVFDVNQPNIHFTISLWQTTNAIENYRQSALFRGIWATVKPWFNAKPEAWSTVSF